MEGGRLPTNDWFLNLQSFASGGFRWAVTHSTTSCGGMWFFDHKGLYDVRGRVRGAYNRSMADGSCYQQATYVKHSPDMLQCACPIRLTPGGLIEASQYSCTEEKRD